MIKIAADIEIYYKISISNSYTIDIANFIETIPEHPNVLSTCKIERSDKATYLLYSVSKNGSTLRQLIETKSINPKSNHPSIRNTIRNAFTHRLTPIDMIVHLIEACEFMLQNNMLLVQSNINPDCIWVEHDETGKQRIYMINQLDTITTNNYADADKCKNYWPPELLSRYNYVTYYCDKNNLSRNAGNQKIILNRNDTRPSTLSSVYSLGLVLHFIVYQKDPFPEQRIHEYDSPHFMQKNKFNKYMLVAINPEMTDRLTLLEWKEFIHKDFHNHKTCNWFVKKMT